MRSVLIIAQNFGVVKFKAVNRLYSNVMAVRHHICIILVF